MTSAAHRAAAAVSLFVLGLLATLVFALLFAPHRFEWLTWWHLAGLLVLGTVACVVIDASDEDIREDRVRAARLVLRTTKTFCNVLLGALLISIVLGTLPTVGGAS